MFNHSESRLYPVTAEKFLAAGTAPSPLRAGTGAPGRGRGLRGTGRGAAGLEEAGPLGGGTPGAWRNEEGQDRGGARASGRWRCVCCGERHLERRRRRCRGCECRSLSPPPPSPAFPVLAGNPQPPPAGSSALLPRAGSTSAKVADAPRGSPLLRVPPCGRVLAWAGEMGTGLRCSSPRAHDESPPHVESADERLSCERVLEAACERRLACGEPLRACVRAAAPGLVPGPLYLPKNC